MAPSEKCFTCEFAHKISAIGPRIVSHMKESAVVCTVCNPSTGNLGGHMGVT